MEWGESYIHGSMSTGGDGVNDGGGEGGGGKVNGDDGR